MIRKYRSAVGLGFPYLLLALLLATFVFTSAKRYEGDFLFPKNKLHDLNSQTAKAPIAVKSNFSNTFALPQVSFEIASTNVIEVPTTITNPNRVTIAVKLSAASTQTVNVSAGLTGSANAVSDYNVVGGSTVLTFNPGETRKLITLDIVYNDRFAENVVFTLNSPSNATIASSLNSHNLNILPNNTTSPTQEVAFVSSTLTAMENVSGTIKIPVVLYSRTNKKVDGTPVDYTVGGTAVLGTDYQILGSPNTIMFTDGTINGENKGAFIEIRPLNNSIADGTRTIIFNLQPNTNSSGSRKQVALGSIPTQTFSIEDDEATATAVANQPPTATNVTNFIIQNTSTGQIGILPLTGFDPDGSVISFTITVLPNASMGRLYLNGAPIVSNQVITANDAKNVKFELNPSFLGPATFQYVVTDNNNATSANQATFTIPVSNMASSTCQNGKLGPNILGATGTFSAPFITPNPVVNSVNNGAIAAAPRSNTGNEKPLLTNYNYASSAGQLGPEGTYSILKTVGLPNITPRNPIKGDWIGSDHTGDGGYFMIFNGATPTVTNRKNGQVIGRTFFKATSITICPNTLYEFSAYVLNVLPGNSSAAGGVATQPNISFFINGENVSTSGPIPYSTAATNYNPQWIKVGGLWYSGNSTSISELRIDNASTAASGNDLGIDDIALSICGPEISYPATGNTPEYCSPGTLPLSAEIKSSTNTYSYYIFQYKANSSSTWIDVSSPKQGNPTYNGSQYIYTATYGNIPVNTSNNGDEYRVKIATDPANLSGADCNVEASTVVHVTTYDPVNVPPPVTICDGSQSTTLTAAASGESWRFVSGPTPATITNAGVVSNMTGIGTYLFELTNTAGCSGQVTVTRDDVNGKAGADVSLCSFFNDYKLADAPSGYKWALGSPNPVTVTINATTGQVNGMTADGTYHFLLTSDNSTCTDEVLITRAPCASPVISITALPSATQTEGTNPLLGLLFAKNFNFRVTLNGNYGTAVNFNYKIRPQPSTVTNAADNNDIYKLLGIIDLFTASANGTIPNGTNGSFIDISIPVQQDLNIEPDEIFTVEIVPTSPGVNVGLATADGLIINDDGPNPFVSFEFPTSTRREKDLTTNFIKVRLTNNAAGTGASEPAKTFTRVNFTIDAASTATPDVDYTFPPNSPGALGYVDFPIGVSEVLIPIDVIDDMDIEPTETVIFNLTSVNLRTVDNAVVATIVPSKRQHTFSILDDDRPPVAVNETYQINECDPVLTGSLALGVDYDPDGETITYILGSYDTSKGTITSFNPNTGDFTFVPLLNPRFEGPLLVNYQVSDGRLTADGVLTIANRFPVLLAVNRVDAVTCFGSNNGIITLEPTGGSVPNGQYDNYIYNWLDGPTTRNRSNLTSGVYRVTITDPGTGCSITRDIAVSQAPEIVIDPIVKDVTCFGGNDGEIDANVSGGTGSFSYLWTYPDATTATTTVIKNLRAGTYRLTVTDLNNSCTKTAATITVNEPAAITNNTISVSIAAYCTAAIPATITGSVPSGGSGPGSFTYKWFQSSDGITYNELVGETQQDYFHPILTQTTYYKRDAYSASCTTASASNSITITINAVPTIAADRYTQAFCSNNTTNINFTNPNAVTGTTYNWVATPNANLTGYSNGSGQNLAQTLINTSGVPQNLIYTITPAANGCDGIPITVTVTVNPLPIATISGTAVVCEGTAAPQISLVGSNGQNPYQFTYSVNGGAAQTISSSGTTAVITQSTATAGQFVYQLLSVQDASSLTCSAMQSGTATITVNALPNATISGNATVFVNDPSPVVTFVGSNGVAPYTFQYVLNGVAHTISTNATSNSVTINQATGVEGTFDYQLVGVTDASSSTCSNPQAGTATVVVLPVSDVTVLKTTSASNYVPGTSVTYTINVYNNGPSDARNVTVTDNAPSGTTITSWSAVASSGTVFNGASSGTGSLLSSIAYLPNAASVTYTATLFIDPARTGTLINTASATSTTSDSDTSNNTSTTNPIPPSPSADVTVLKTTSASVYIPGTSITYTINVYNNGPSDARNVTVTDNAPAGTTITSWSAVASSGTVFNGASSGTGNLLSSIAYLPNAASATYTVTLFIDPARIGTLTNTASATSTTSDSDTSNNTSTTNPIPPSPSADVTVLKTTSASVYIPGTPITYTINVRNNGPSDARNVTVTDNAPAGTTITSWSAVASLGTVFNGASSGTGNLSSNISYLPNAASVTYTVILFIDPARTGTLINTSSATSTTSDSDTSNNTSTTNPVPPSPSADVTVLKNTSASVYIPGTSITYTINAHNNGPSDARNVTVTDNAPSGTTITSWSAVGSSGTVFNGASNGTGNLLSNIAYLPNAASVTYTVTLFIDPARTGTLINTASATSTTSDSDTSNNTSTTNPVPPSPSADITILKTTASTTYVPGTSVTYTINVHNNGPSDARNVTITDNAPSGTTITSWSAVASSGTVFNGASNGTGNLLSNIAYLPNAASVTYTVTLFIDPARTGTLTNTASATSTTSDSDTSNNTSTTNPIPPSPSADITVLKNTASATYVPGTSVTYTINVYNNGPSDARNVTITDNAPAGTTITSWSAVASLGTVFNGASSGTGNLSSSISYLPNAASVTYTVILFIDPARIGTLTNTASATSTTSDSDTSNNTSTTNPVPPSPLADITILKTTASTTYVPGTSVTYTINAHNNGPSDARNVTVTDNAPAGTTITSWSAVGSSGTVFNGASNGTGNLLSNIAYLPNAASVTYTVTLFIDPARTGTLINTASATSTTSDSDTSNNTSTTNPVPPAPNADITVLKATSASNYVPGTSITYTINVHNNGPSDARNVNVTDNAPLGTTITSWSAVASLGTVFNGASSGTGNLSSGIAYLPNAASVTYTVTLFIDPARTGTLTNTASATSTTSDSDTSNNTSTTNPIPPSPSADVTVLKTTSASNYVPGTSVTYTINVYNNGPSDARNVTVADNAPLGTTITSWSAMASSGTVFNGASSGTGNLLCGIAYLPNAASATYTVTLFIDPARTGTLTNTASATSTTSDSDTSNNTSTTNPIPPSPSADVTVLKTTSASVYIPGTSITYTINVHNNGPSDDRNVTVTDNAPAGTTITSWSAVASSGTVFNGASSGTGNLLSGIAYLPNAASVTYTVTLFIDPARTGTLTNTASATSTTSDSDTSNNTSTTNPVPPSPSADVTLLKTTASTTYVPGTSVTYTINVHNNGPSDARNVTVTDNAPLGTTITSWSAVASSGTIFNGASSGTGNLLSSIAYLPNAASATYTVTLFIDPARTGTLINTASATSTTSDSDTSNNTSTTNPVPPSPSADITVLKTTSASVYIPGTSITYTINVHNNGPSDARNVTVTDNAPAGTTITSWSAVASSGTVFNGASSGTGNLSSSISYLPNAASVTYTVTLFIDPARTGTLTNTASATSTTSDSDTSNNTSTTNPVPPSPSADITVLKTTSASVYIPGTSITYTINVHNNGPSDARNVTVTDNAPSGTTITSWSAVASSGTVFNGVSSGTGNLLSGITYLPNAASVTYTVTLFIDAARTGTLTNTASATSTTSDSDTSNNTSTTNPIPPSPLADVTVLKTTSASVYIPGTSITYTINVHNNGPSDARNVTVTDNAPLGTNITSWSAVASSGTVFNGASNGTGNLLSNIAYLPNAASVTYTVTLFIDPARTGTLTNTASATSTTSDSDTSNNTSTTNPVPPSHSADVTVLKTTSASNYVPGTAVTYTINVKNSGPSDARNVTITDNAPSGTTITSWSAVASSGTVFNGASSGTGNLLSGITYLPNAALVTYTVTLFIDPARTGTLTNTASATSTTSDSDTSNNTSTTNPVPPSPSADVTVLKTTSASNYVPGTSVTYTINVHNNGPSDARNVTVTDNAPLGTTITSWSAVASSGTVFNGASSGTGNLSSSISYLPNAASVTYTVTLFIDPARTGTLTNTASATSTTSDSDTSNNTSTTNPIPPAPSADIRIFKTNQQTSYTPGMPVTYLITVFNNGPSNATNVTVIDNPPSGITAASMTWRRDNGPVQNGPLTDLITSMASGVTITYNVTFTVPSSYIGNLSNTASATATTSDPDTSTNTSTDVDTPNALADLVSVKLTAQTEYTPGGTVTYTINVKNNGPSDARNVVIKDLAPAGTTMQSWSASSNTIPSFRPNGVGDLNETIQLFPNQAAINYIVVLRIPSTYADPLINTVSVTSTTTDPNPSCAGCTTPSLLPQLEADLLFEKILKNPLQTHFVPGQDIEYLIKITNRGPGMARDVRVVDKAPSGTSIRLWLATATNGATVPNISGAGDINEIVGNLPVNGMISYEVTLKTDIDITTPVKNVASISASTNDPTPGAITNPDPSCDTCAPAPTLSPTITIDLSIVKTADTFPIGVDMQYNYALTVTNHGYFTAHNVVITDRLPLQVAYMPDQTVDRQQNYEAGSRMITIKIDSIAPQEKKIFSFKVKALTLGKVENIADVKADEPDPDLTNNNSVHIKEVVGLKIPDVITPNGDGYNDQFVIPGIELFKSNLLIIYNRWGNEVFRSPDGYKNNWDGNGLSGGTYYYILKLTDHAGSEQTLKGYISLLKK